MSDISNILQKISLYSLYLKLKNFVGILNFKKNSSKMFYLITYLKLEWKLNLNL